MNEHKGFVTTKEAKKALGVKEDALRKWADQGFFPSVRTPGGQRLYNIAQYLKNQDYKSENTKEESLQKICYCRVSSHGQKDDLKRQIEYMQSRYPDYRIITDIGSGINFKRPGFRTILELSTKHLVSEVVVAYRDRLCPFAFELVEWLLSTNGVELVVLNKNLESSGQTELAEDLLAIINVFNCRVNGKRKYERKDKKEQAKEDGQTVT